jgi:methylmalonyl-CoA mutase cobalamin-binding domain/chain
MSYKELDLEELYLQMQDDLYDGVKEEIPQQVKAALEQGQTPQQILDGGLVAGMDIVGVDFRDGILFVPEVLLTETGAERVGTAVVGTVKGDIHDIGKNLVAMMLEGAGFEVINLGINVDADKFIAAINEHKPDIIGMSALLTTTMPYMKVVVDALGEEGLREQIYVMVGGAPVTENFARDVGADAYGRDAAVSVEIAKRYMARKHKTARDAKAAANA